MQAELSSLTDQKLDELRQSVAHEIALRQAKLREQRDVSGDRHTVCSYTEGLIIGLLWPDRWGINAKPGGPYVYGNNNDELNLSRLCNDMWREGWANGIKERVRLDITIPDHLLSYRSDLEDRLISQLKGLIYSDRIMPECGFEIGDRIAIDGSSTCGTILHKISLSTREFVLYLIKIKGELNFVFRGGSDLQYYCEKKNALSYH